MNEFKSGFNELYDALLEALPNKEFTVNDVKYTACEKINALGPFERGVFDASDVVHMLGHLSERKLVSVRSDDKFSRTGRFEGNTLYYTVVKAA